MYGLYYWSFSILEGLCRMVPHIPMARMKSSRVEIFSTNLTLWEWSSGISSQYCDSWQNMGSSLWPRNKVSVHGITLQGKKNQNFRGKKGYSFWGWCYSHGFPWSWGQYLLRVLHCNAQNFETIIKQSSEAQKKNATIWQHQISLEAIVKLNFTVLPYSLSSPDTAFCDFHLFFKNGRNTSTDISLTSLKR